MYRPTGVTYAPKWSDLCTRPITWVPYAPRISGVTSAPVKSKVRWAYEERADFGPPVEAASTTHDTGGDQRSAYVLTREAMVPAEGTEQMSQDVS